MKCTKLIWGSSIALAVGIGIASSSLHLGMNSAWAEERYEDLQNFTKVLNLIQQYYVEPVDTKN